MSDHQTQLEAGSTDFNGPRQFYRIKPIVLATNAGGEGSTFSTAFKMRVPSSQVRVKLSLLFASRTDPGNISKLGTIWIAGCEEDEAGGGNGAGNLIPVTDVEGTSAAPTEFPQSAGLLGYSREFVTAADWVQAVVTIPTIGVTAGAWMIQASIQPESVILPWRAWDEMRRLFSVELTGPKGRL